MAQTVSFSKGRIAIKHDIREVYTPNIDKTLSHKNVILRDELRDFDYDLTAYTNNFFQPYIDEYNAKQTRADRRKEYPYSYYIREENGKRNLTNIKNQIEGQKKKSSCEVQMGYEYVLQHGNHETNPTGSCDVEKERRYFEEVLAKIEKKYPHVKILLATLHVDEPNGTPHCHVLLQFVGEHYKQGLSHQLSVSKALELDGLKRADTRAEGYQMERMVKDIQDNIMTPVLKEMFNEERDVLGDSRSNIPLQVFRKKSREENEYLEHKRKAVEDEIERRRSYFILENNELENEKVYLESQIEAQKDALKRNYDELDWIESQKKQGVKYVEECKLAEQRVKELEAKKRSFEGEIDDIERDLDNIKSLRNELRTYINRKAVEFGYEFKDVSDNYLDDVKMAIQQTKDKLNKGNTEHHAPKNHRGFDR